MIKGDMIEEIYENVNNEFHIQDRLVGRLYQQLGKLGSTESKNIETTAQNVNLNEKEIHLVDIDEAQSKETYAKKASVDGRSSDKPTDMNEDKPTNMKKDHPKDMENDKPKDVLIVATSITTD